MCRSCDGEISWYVPKCYIQVHVRTLYVERQHLAAKLEICHSFLESVSGRPSLVALILSLLQRRLYIRPLTLTLLDCSSTKEGLHFLRGFRMIDDSRRSLYAPALEPLLGTVIHCVR
jgi:hypothetical protein